MSDTNASHDEQAFLSGKTHAVPTTIRDWGLHMREWGAGCEKMRVFSLSPSSHSLQHRKHVRLAIIVALYRARQTTDVKNISSLKF